MRALQSAHDHLSAWQDLAHARPRRIMAHYSLLRTAVDGASRARWLFEPRLTADVRAGRGYRSELTDRLEVVKVDKLDRRRSDPSPPPEALAQELRDLAAADGVQIAPHRKYTALAATYATFPSRYKGSGAYLYSILSAAAHGHVWADHLARKAVLRGPGVADLPIHIMDAETALWATEIVLDIVTKAVSEAEAYAKTGEPGILVAD
jgi:hypothetical protein